MCWCFILADTCLEGNIKKQLVRKISVSRLIVIIHNWSNKLSENRAEQSTGDYKLHTKPVQSSTEYCTNIETFQVCNKAVIMKETWLNYSSKWTFEAEM